MLKKYIAREPKVDVVHTSNKDDTTIAVEGYHQKERVRDVKLGVDLSEDQLYAEGLEGTLMYLQKYYVIQRRVKHR